MKDPLDDEIATAADPLDAEIAAPAKPPGKSEPSWYTPAVNAVKGYGEAASNVGRDILHPVEAAKNIDWKGAATAIPDFLGMGMANAVMPGVGPPAYLAGARLIEGLLQGKPWGQAAEESATAGYSGMIPAVPGPILGRMVPQVSTAGRNLAEIGKQAGFSPLASDIAAPSGARTTVRGVQNTAQNLVGGGPLSRRDLRENMAMRGNPETGEPGWIFKQTERVSGPAPASPEDAGVSVREGLASGQARRTGRFEAVKNRFLQKSGAEPLDEGIRGEGIAQGVKSIQEANKFQDDILWDAHRASDTGTPNFPLNRTAEMASDVIKQGGQLQSLLQRGETSARLRPEGGQVAPVSETTVGPVNFYNKTKTDLTTQNTPSVEMVPERLITEGGAYTTTGQVNAPAESLYQRLANMQGRKVTFMEADALRKELGNRIAAGDPSAKAVYKGVMEDMESWGSQLPNSPEVETLANARQWHRENVVPFQPGEVLGSVAKMNEPVKLINTLLPPNDTGVTRLKAFLQQTQGKGPAWDSLRGAAIQRGMESQAAFEKMGPITRGTLFRPDEEAFIAKYHTLSTQEKPVVRKFMSLTPSEIPARVMSMGEKGITDITTLQRTLGSESPAWKSVQQDLIHRITKDSSELNRVNMNWAKSVFTPDQVDLLNMLKEYNQTSGAARRYATTDMPAPTGKHGPMAIQILSATEELGQGIYAAVQQNWMKASVHGGAAAAITLGPAVIAKIATSPRLTRLMLDGMKERAGSVRGFQITAELQRRLKQENPDEGVNP